MAQLAKIDDRFLKRTDQAKDMRVGEEAYFTAEAIRIDIDGLGWVDPLAVRVDQHVSRYQDGTLDAPIGWTQLMILKRIESGFVAELTFLMMSYRGPIWEKTAIPDPAITGELPWIPIAEYVYGKAN